MADPIDGIYCLSCRALVDRFAPRCPVCGKVPTERPSAPDAPQGQALTLIRDDSDQTLAGRVSRDVRATIDAFMTPDISPWSEREVVLPYDVEKQISRIVWEEIYHWPETKRASFVYEYRRQRKSLLMGFVTFLFGSHYLYLGQVGMFFAYILTGGVCGLWAIADFFRLPYLVQRYNQSRQMELVAWLRGREDHP